MTFTDIEIDTSDVLQSELNISIRERTNLLPWKGQFSPQLVETLLRTYGPSHGSVIDPFGGSGTVLVESSFRGLSSVGFEINPAAFYLANVYSLAGEPPHIRAKAISTYRKAVTSVVGYGTLSTSLLPVSGFVRAHDSCKDRFAKRLLAAHVVLLDASKDGDCTVKASERHLARLTNLVESLPESVTETSMHLRDARHTGLAAGSIDFLITSPPYINVFNYHQQYRPSVEAMGGDVLSAARSEIGSNRKNRGNRFLTVIQYCLDMGQVLKEMSRVCKKGSRMIFVVGRTSNVLGTPFENGLMVSRLAVEAVGLMLITRQERRFTNRFGQVIIEDILHFQSTGIATFDIEHVAQKAREIAVEFLNNGRISSTPSAALYIDLALSKVNMCQPSPILPLQADGVV